MAYSVVGIVNLALGKIGVGRISSLTEDSEQAIVANSILQYIRDEVLEAYDWKFATVRKALVQSTIEPANFYSYAYPLPADFLRLTTERRNDPRVYPNGVAYAAVYNITGNLLSQSTNYNYVIETLSDGTLCLFTDYDNTSQDIYITYIRRVTDPAKYSPSFVSAFAFRLAAEIAIPRTEGMKKYEAMMTLYQQALLRAKELNQQLDYNAETGNDDWESAGR